MIKVTIDYEEAVNHYPSYKKITTRKYFFGFLYYTRVEKSDALFIPKSPRR
jgi:hypothetical protein